MEKRFLRIDRTLIDLTKLVGVWIEKWYDDKSERIDVSIFALMNKNMPNFCEEIYHGYDSRYKFYNFITKSKTMKSIIESERFNSYDKELYFVYLDCAYFSFDRCYNPRKALTKEEKFKLQKEKTEEAIEKAIYQEGGKIFEFLQSLHMAYKSFIDYDCVNIKRI